jgi:hypothetical protein
MNIDDGIDSFKETMKKKLPTEEHRISMILTLLGCSGHITEFLVKNFGIKHLPNEIKYSCALVAGNMLALTSDHECKVEDKSNDYKMGEQTQERLYRVFKEIVFLLYDSIKEEEEGI